VPVVWISVTTLTGVEWAANILNTPVGDLDRIGGIGDINQTKIAFAVLVAPACVFASG
jgi:hypothetical protein